MEYFGEFMTGNFLHILSLLELMAGDFMTRNFLAGNLMAHRVTFGDFMTRNFLTGDFWADTMGTHT